MTKLNPMQNVALVGRFCSGKTTIANQLVGMNFTRYSLADELKDIAQRVWGDGRPIIKSKTYSTTSLDGTTRIMTGRELLQSFGQSVKATDRDFWIKCLLSRIRGTYDQIVVDDVRFPYEADALRAYNFLIVKVSTPQALRMDRYKSIYGREPTESELNHESEQSISDVRYDMLVSGRELPSDNARAIARRSVGDFAVDLAVGVDGP